MGVSTVTRRRRKWIGILLIAAGVLCLLYFLWINFAGSLLREVYTSAYENGNVKVDEYGNFTGIDGWPSFLFAGQGFFSDEGVLDIDEDAFLEEDGAVESDGDETPNETVTKKPNQSETNQSGNSSQKAGTYTDRSLYVSKHMNLSVPRMGVNAKVYNGTTQSALKNGIGLYTFSDLPGAEPHRVIVAAHRTGYGSWFYNVDKLKTGDKAYVTFGKYVYVYAFQSYVICEKTDWSALRRKETSTLILTTCHPKNTNNKRYICTFDLIEVLVK